MSVSEYSGDKAGVRIRTVNISFYRALEMYLKSNNYAVSLRVCWTFYDFIKRERERTEITVIAGYKLNVS